MCKCAVFWIKSRVLWSDCVQMRPTLHGFLLTSEHSLSFFSWHLHQALLEVHEYAKLESFVFLAQFQQLCPRPLYHAFPSRWAVLNFVQLKKVVLLPWRGTSAHELVVVCQQLCDVGCSQFCVRHNAHPTALSPLPSLPPSSLHPLSANSSPHITTRSSELPPAPPYFSVGIFQMDCCSTRTDLWDVSVPFFYVSASWKVYFFSNAFESNDIANVLKLFLFAKDFGAV